MLVSLSRRDADDDPLFARGTRPYGPPRSRTGVDGDERGIDHRSVAGLSAARLVGLPGDEQ
jgi:hypothetical protein